MKPANECDNQKKIASAGRKLPLLGHHRCPWLLALSAAVVSLAAALIINPGSHSLALPVSPANGRAAIVDQLAWRYPNPDFIARNTAVLEAAGFEVDVFSGEKVNVGFWRDLPSYGYKLLVLRTHAGLKGESSPESHLWVFTNEPYSHFRYPIAQIRDQVAGAKTREKDAPLVFAVSARFVKDCMHGDFTGTLVINMGCTALYTDEFASAFTGRGAAAYLAWDSSVSLPYIDNATTVLLENLYKHKLSIQSAITETMQKNGPDPYFGAVLGYYPAEAGSFAFK